MWLKPISPYLAEGGRPVKVRILSRKLAERGHDVTVLTVNLGSVEWAAANVTPKKTLLRVGGSPKIESKPFTFQHGLGIAPSLSILASLDFVRHHSGIMMWFISTAFMIYSARLSLISAIGAEYLT